VETKRFSTFEGVFTPTVLSILGVVMYLRLGWVVGQVGLVRALTIIALANLITLCTGLSIACIITNQRIGTGGAYAIISKSLGLEAGGAIGVPLYLSQAISIAFYITGFSECWVLVFPQHNFIFVALYTWLGLLVVSYLSARLAFRLQYAVIAIIAASLVSVFMGKNSFQQSVALWQGVGGVGFWRVFAIFFPAVTGILAGVSMSGELRDPEKSIPRGVLSAIIITLLIYMALAVWFAFSASSQDLVNNTAIIIDLAKWRFLVIAGLMGATLSSALSMFVASPRTLLALGKHRVIPFSNSFHYVNPKGEPSTAILFTALIALLTIALGNLNSIAGLLTMFFLITYGTLNSAVFIEQTIGIASFRPRFKVAGIISLLGSFGCIYAMFLINQLFSIIAILTTLLIYFILVRRQVQRSWPDVRKGLFIFIAEEVLKISSRLPYHPKIWKPNLIIPVEEPRNWVGMIDFIRAVSFPRGRISFLSILDAKLITDIAAARKKRKDDFLLLTEPLREEGIFTTPTVIDTADISAGLTIATQVSAELPLCPNVLFIKLGLDSQKDAILKVLIERAQSLKFGTLILALHPKSAFGQRKKINLWVRQGSPNVHLAVLIALQLEKNWEAELRVLQAVSDSTQKNEAEEYLHKFKRLMRLSQKSQMCVLTGKFEEVITGAPAADINIFGMTSEVDIARMRWTSDAICTSCIFLRDSEQENAVA